jgi:hypothetical protein
MNAQISGDETDPSKEGCKLRFNSIILFEKSLIFKP